METNISTDKKGNIFRVFKQKFCCCNFFICQDETCELHNTVTDTNDKKLNNACYFDQIIMVY